MKKGFLFWLAAFLITISAVYYQRLTGPTKPKQFKITDVNNVYKFRLTRSADTGNDLKLSIPAANKAQGFIFYKRYKTADNWKAVRMVNTADTLAGFLPSQPPAGKLIYTVQVKYAESGVFHTVEPVIVRFKGHVPVWILILHAVLMFVAMFFSNYTGLIAGFNKPKQMKWALITVSVTLIGGLFLGPVVQKYAFGEFWTGVPFGWDLTDNKTLIGFTGWVIAIIANYKKERRGWFIFAAVLTFIVYSIPHSMFGSELDYSSGVVKQG